MKQTLPPRNTPLKVTWFDSTSLPGWNYSTDDQSIDFAPRKIVTMGILIGVNPVAILVAGSYSEPLVRGGQAGHLDALVIPRGCILAVEPCA